MDSEYSLSEKDLDVIGEQVARIWLMTRGFTIGYPLNYDDIGSDEDEADYLDEDIYDY